MTNIQVVPREQPKGVLAIAERCLEDALNELDCAMVKVRGARERLKMARDHLQWQDLQARPAINTADTRTCTCHPDDNPPRPCPRKYAYSECVAAARK